MQSVAMVQRLLGLGCVVGGLIALSACDKKTDSSSGASSAAVSAPSEPRQEFDESAFRVAMREAGSYKSGDAAHIEVLVQAKAPYKVNDKYPIQLKLEPNEGVAFESDTVGKDKTAIQGKEAVMTVGFTPQSTGEKQIAGELRFSVCDAKNCLLEKRQLAMKVEVK